MNKRIATLWKFLTYDIWRITEDEVTKTTFSLYLRAYQFPRFQGG
jgi:membrane protein